MKKCVAPRRHTFFANKKLQFSRATQGYILTKFHHHRPCGCKSYRKEQKPEKTQFFQKLIFFYLKPQYFVGFTWKAKNGQKPKNLVVVYIFAHF